MAEALELAQFNMDVELEVLEATDRTINVSVNTVSGGSGESVINHNQCMY